MPAPSLVPAPLLLCGAAVAEAGVVTPLLDDWRGPGLATTGAGARG